MVGPDTKVDSDDHIVGVIDSDELVARAASPVWPTEPSTPSPVRALGD